MTKIVQDGDVVLRKMAIEIPLSEIKSPKIKGIIKKMSETIKKREDAVALAAPQIGKSLQIFIVKYKVESKPDFDYKIFINPKIIKISRKKKIVSEGCLSVEGIEGEIKRAEKVVVEAYDEHCKKFIRGTRGLLAQIIQHEIDHLNGILFTDTAKNLHSISDTERQSGKTLNV